MKYETIRKQVLEAILDAVEQGLAVIDAGHYGTEYIFIEDMKQFLQTRLPSLKVVTAPIIHPFQVL